MLVLVWCRGLGVRSKGKEEGDAQVDGEEVEAEWLELDTAAGERRMPAQLRRLACLVLQCRLPHVNVAPQLQQLLVHPPLQVDPAHDHALACGPRLLRVAPTGALAAPVGMQSCTSLRCAAINTIADSHGVYTAWRTSVHT